MKYFILLLMILVPVSCTTETVYLKPAIKGQLIDERTGQPIRNKGYVAAFIRENNEGAVETDNQGAFYLEATIDKRLIKTHVYQKYQNIPLEIYIYIDGYEDKIFDFGGFPRKPKDGGIFKKSEVDVGVIKLTPVKIN